jgi:pteridine reductase
VPAVLGQGRVALVTGAGRRLGREIALALGRAGFGVAVHHGNSAEAAQATVEELASMGVRAAAVGADLRQPDAIEDLLASVETIFGRLDVLVNSAASFERRPLLEIDATSWDDVLALNLRAPFLCLRAAAPLLARSARAGGEAGAVVNLCDLSAFVPWRGHAHHGSSKAALLHLTRAAALELAPEIRVNAVVPGAILPPPGVAEDSPAWSDVGRRLPLGRVGSARHVTQAVLYLISNDFVTGEALVVDGGELLRGSSKP